LEPLARKGERACRGDVVDVVARALAPRAALAVPGDRAVHEVALRLLEGLVVDSKALRDARSEAFDHDVGVADEAMDDLLRRSVLEIEREAPLVPVLGLELHRDVASPRVAGRHL